MDPWRMWNTGIRWSLFLLRTKTLYQSPLTAWAIWSYWFDALCKAMFFFRKLLSVHSTVNSFWVNMFVLMVVSIFPKLDHQARTCNMLIHHQNGSVHYWLTGLGLASDGYTDCTLVKLYHSTPLSLLDHDVVSSWFVLSGRRRWFH